MTPTCNFGYILLILDDRAILGGLIPETVTQVLHYLTTLIYSEKWQRLFEGGSFSVKLCNSISLSSRSVTIWILHILLVWRVVIELLD